jgi:hypothetical protein
VEPGPLYSARWIAAKAPAATTTTAHKQQTSANSNPPTTNHAVLSDLDPMD